MDLLLSGTDVLFYLGIGQPVFFFIYVGFSTEFCVKIQRSFVCLLGCW